MNWDWNQIRRDAIIAVGLTFVLCAMGYFFGL
jgi:hypothetical protein